MLNAIRLICSTLDGLFGDPQGKWHPVVLIGKIINNGKVAFRRKTLNEFLWVLYWLFSWLEGWGYCIILADG